MEEPTNIEIYFQNKSFGFASILDPNVNAKIGRDYKKPFPPKKTNNTVMEKEKSIASGQLFKGGIENDSQ